MISATVGRPGSATALTTCGARQQPPHSYHSRSSAKRLQNLLLGLRVFNMHKAALVVERAASANASSLPSWVSAYVSAEEAAQYAPTQLEFLARKRGGSPDWPAPDSPAGGAPPATAAKPAAASAAPAPAASSSGGSSSWVTAFVTPEEAASFTPTQLEFLARKRGGSPGAAAPTAVQPTAAAKGRPGILRPASARPTSIRPATLQPAAAAATGSTAAKFTPEQLEFMSRKGQAGGGTAPTPASAAAQAQPAEAARGPPIMRPPSLRPGSARPVAPRQPPSATAAPVAPVAAAQAPPASRPVRRPGSLRGSMRRSAPQQPPPAAAQPVPVQPKAAAVVERPAAEPAGALPSWVLEFTSKEEVASLLPSQLEFMARKRRAAKGLGPIMPTRSACKACNGIGQCKCSQCKGTGLNDRDGHEIMTSGRVIENNGLTSSKWFFSKDGPCWLCRGMKEMACPDCRGTGFQGGMEGFTGD